MPFDGVVPKPSFAVEAIVRYLTISDIHLGHNRTKTEEIKNHLWDYFDGYTPKSPFSKVDIIFIDGDLFDRLLDCSSSDIYIVLEFLNSLCAFCVRHCIRLRIMEGTPSHDRQQSRMVEMLSKIKAYDADIRWINTLTIERIADLNLTILYIPDEFTSSTQITLGLVKDLLKENHLEQVDITHMHGMFAWQMEGIPGRHDTHDLNAYLSITKHFINIGHIHTHSVRDRAIAQGSFDRLAHGEEENKGGVLTTIRDNGSDYYEFIPNKKAKTYKTIEVKTNDLDKAIAQVEKICNKLPDGSYLRIKASKLHSIYGMFGTLRKKYPFLTFDKLSFEDQIALTKTQVETSEHTYQAVEIRPENVVTLIVDELPQIVDRDRQQLTRLLETLKEAI